MKSDLLRIDFKDSQKFLELIVHFESCENCLQSYETSKKSKLENLVLEIPTVGPLIIDFK